MPSLAAVMMREGSMASEAVRNAAMGPNESEIAALAYLLWQVNGCRDGTDKEDWFLAEAILKNAQVVKDQYLSGRPSVPRGDTRTEFEMLAECQWEGHWVIWESEWGGARWIRDIATPGVEISNRSMAIS